MCTTIPGKLIHTDISGKIEPTAVGGFIYYSLFIDDATRMTYYAPMKTNVSQELLGHFKEFRKLINNELDTKIKRLRTDNGSEYKKHVDKFLKQKGIKHELTAPYHPDQNGVAENANRTIMERTRAVIEDGKFPKKLWAEIAGTVVYLKNRSSTKALDNQTPYEAWYKEKPDVQHLRILGSPAYIHVPKEKHIKLDNHTIKGQLVGYGGQTNGKHGYPKGMK